MDLQNVSVISATMRPEDLIPAFITAIFTIDTTMENQLRSKLLTIEEEIANDDNYFESDGCQYDLDWLFDILDSLAPEGFYFGSHPGDGSDYGFWECVDSDFEL